MDHAETEERRRAREPVEHWHTTRMVPNRVDEVTSGGSLYWVIKGSVQYRQRITEIRLSMTTASPLPSDARSAGRAHGWQPRRAFQGWRYLKPEDAPADRAVACGSWSRCRPNCDRNSELGLL